MKTIILSLLLVLFVAAPAFAGDVAAEDSAAGRAYREAWWSETGSGDLAHALELYEKVQHLAGSDAVKALALFRKGVVLERLGRTEEAIHVFQTLAETYPGETALQQEARRRMDAWTAEDLEGSFDEWYERYRYSPQFQAKVVDLVLALGTKRYDPKTGSPAEEKELLTIGDAARPALRRHVDTTNDTLRAWVVALLLQLGEVPPADAMLETSVWQRREKAWTTLLTLPEERAEALRAALPEEGETAMLIATATRGPEAALALFRADRRQPSELLDAVLERPGGHPSVEELVAFVEAADATAGQAAEYSPRKALRTLLDQGDAPDELVLHVLRAGPSGAWYEVLSRLQRGEWKDPGAAKALAEGTEKAIAARQVRQVNAYSLQGALVVAASWAPEKDLDAAARALEQVVQVSGNFSYNANQLLPRDFWGGVLRLVPRIIEGGGDVQARGRLMAVVENAARGREPEAERARQLLLDWTRTLDESQLRGFAARGVGSCTREDTLDSALAATDGLGEKELNELVQGLGRQEGGALRWTPDRLGLLLRRYKQLQDAGAMSHVPPLYMVVDTENIASALIDRVLEAPAEAPHGTLDAITNRSELEGSETLRGKLRQGLMQRWKDWDLAQREAAVNLADHLGPRLAADDDFAVWIRSVFRAKAAERAPTDDAREARRRIHGILLGWLPEPTLEDVRAVYDLSDPEQAMQAAMLRRLPRRLEMYRAVSAAAHVPDAGAREAFWARWDGSSEAVPEDVLHAVARGMLGDPDPGAREKAVGMLRNFRDADDLPLLVKALKDPNAGVRRTAALALAEVYDRSAILALAAAVDDPDPLVRAAVLQTLETIKKAEDLKDYWRKFAEER